MSDPGARARNGYTALMLAAERGHHRCVRALLPLSDPLAADHAHRSVLHLAAGSGCAASIALLLPACDPNARDTRGTTPLMWAADSSRSIETIALLLHAADPDATTPHGLTALGGAVNQGWTEAAQLIMQKMRNIELMPPEADRARKCGHYKLAGLIDDFYRAKKEQLELDKASASPCPQQHPRPKL